MNGIEGVRENFRRGLTELLILLCLSESDKSACQLAKEIVERTNGLIDLNMTSFYGPIYRLLSYKYVKEYTVPVSPLEKRSYYSITPEGREYYRLLLDEYKHTNNQIAQVFDLIEREE